MVELLLKYNADLTARDAYNLQAIHYAAYEDVPVLNEGVMISIQRCAICYSAR